MERKKITLSEFNTYPVCGEIKLMGNEVAVVRSDGRHVRISESSVQGLKKRVLAQPEKGGRIKLTGVSRSLLCHIARDLRGQEDHQDVDVYIYEAHREKNVKPKLNQFEILMRK